MSQRVEAHIGRQNPENNKHRQDAGVHGKGRTTQPSARVPRSNQSKWLERRLCFRNAYQQVLLRKWAYTLGVNSGGQNKKKYTKGERQGVATAAKEPIKQEAQSTPLLTHGGNRVTRACKGEDKKEGGRTEREKKTR